MILCIDSGNTRLKWGLSDGQRWLETGAFVQNDYAPLQALAERLQPARTLVANVAGETSAEAISAAFAGYQETLDFVRTGASAAGISNGYTHPAQLGVDRWCALIGARHQTAGAVVVVGSGTATTIDTLDENSRFLGGFILPGFELMRRSLASNTAQLPLASGDWLAYPRSTEDAIVSGCLEAQLGAIERAWQRIAERPDATCLLFGGNAGRLADQLSCPHRLIDNLVLEGLRILAACRT